MDRLGCEELERTVFEALWLATTPMNLSGESSVVERGEAVSIQRRYRGRAQALRRRCTDRV